MLSAFVFLYAILALTRVATADTVARAGFATIANDPDAGTWTIASSGTSLVLALGATRDFEILRLSSLSNQPWTIGNLPDTFLKVGGQTLPFGNRAAGFVYQTVTTTVKGLTVQLDAVFEVPAARLRATRHYAATSGSPTFETWTTFTPTAGAVSLSDLNGFRLTVPAGTLRWLNGLQGNDPKMPRDAAFTLQQRARAGNLARQGRRQVRILAGRANLPCERGSAAVGARPPHAPHRHGPARLPAVVRDGARGRAAASWDAFQASVLGGRTSVLIVLIQSPNTAAHILILQRQ